MILFNSHNVLRRGLMVSCWKGKELSLSHSRWQCRDLNPGLSDIEARTVNHFVMQPPNTWFGDCPRKPLWILPYPPPHSPLKQQNSQPKWTEVVSLVAPAFSALQKSLGGPGANHAAGRTTGTAVQMYLTGTSVPVILCQLPHKGREKLFSWSTPWPFRAACLQLVRIWVVLSSSDV